MPDDSGDRIVSSIFRSTQNWFRTSPVVIDTIPTVPKSGNLKGELSALCKFKVVSYMSYKESAMKLSGTDAWLAACTMYVEWLLATTRGKNETIAKLVINKRVIIGRPTSQ